MMRCLFAYTIRCFCVLSLAGCTLAAQLCQSPPSTEGTSSPSPESAIPHDTQLVGQWYWIDAQTPDEATPFAVQRAERGWPYITFTLKPYPPMYGLEYEGYSGCNSVFGSYHAIPAPTRTDSSTEHVLIIFGVGRTAMQCEGREQEEGEERLVQALGNFPVYSIDGNRLTLRPRSGAVLTFQREVPDQ